MSDQEALMIIKRSGSADLIDRFEQYMYNKHVCWIVFYINLLHLSDFLYVKKVIPDINILCLFMMNLNFQLENYIEAITKSNSLTFSKSHITRQAFRPNPLLFMALQEPCILLQQ